MTPVVYVRYCVSGHEIRFSGLCPSNCPVCGGPVDRSRRPISLEELESQKTAEPAKEKKAVSEPEALPVRSVEDIVPVAEEPTPPPPAAVRRPMRSRISLNAAAVPAGTPQPEGLPAAGHIPLQKREPSNPDVKYTPTGVDLLLNFFGETVVVPEKGAWLGREGLGASFFEGNRYISRKHVFVKPDQNERLLVQKDHSLNGVYYDKGNGKQKLPKDSTVILRQGDILWLYNIPLRLERKKQ